MDDTTYVIAVVTATFLLAGCVKGVVGMGLPIVAMGLLGAVMAPLQAASLLVVPSLVTNLWQMVAGPELRVLSKRFASMMATVLPPAGRNARAAFAKCSLMLRKPPTPARVRNSCNIRTSGIRQR